MTGSYEQNGLMDGWIRPAGGVSMPTGGSGCLYAKRGIALEARYIVFWETPSKTGRLGLRCCFDTLNDANAYITTRSDYRSSGIWDRHANKWAPE